MAIENYIPIGKLIKPHKLSGAFRFFVDRDLKSKKRVPEHFMLNINGNYLPWFVKDIEWIAAGEGIILFEDVSTPEKAKQYAGSELFLSESEITQYFKSESKTIDYLIGYSVLLKDKSELGHIEEIFETPGQTLLSIKHDGKEILIPFVADFVVKINKPKRELILDLPEGLVEL